MQSSYDRMRQQQLMQQQADTLRAQQQYYQAAARNLNQNCGNSYVYQPAPYVDPIYQQPMPHYGHQGYYGHNPYNYHVATIDPIAYQMAVMEALANGLGGEPDIY